MSTPVRLTARQRLSVHNGQQQNEGCFLDTARRYIG